MGLRKENVRTRFLATDVIRAVDRWGDSTGSQTAGVQSGVDQWNFADMAIGGWANVIGFQMIADLQNSTSQETARLAAMDAKITILAKDALISGVASINSFGTPGRTNNTSAGGITSFTHLQTQLLTFDGNVSHAGTPTALNIIMRWSLANSSGAASSVLQSLTDGWKALFAYLDDSGETNSDLASDLKARFIGGQGGTRNHDNVWNPDTTTQQANNSGDAMTYHQGDLGTATGLKAVSTSLSSSSDTGTLLLEWAATNEDETGAAVPFVPPIFYKSNASGGLVLIKGGYSGWNYDDWVRSTGSNTDYITTGALEQTYAILEDEGITVDTLVLDLGINGIFDASEANIKAAIEKFHAARPTTTTPTVVLIITPWITDGFTLANKNTLLARVQNVCNDGTTNVLAANIDYLDRAAFLNNVAVGLYTPAGGSAGDYGAEGDDNGGSNPVSERVHPSFAAKATSVLEWTEISGPLALDSTDTNPRLRTGRPRRYSRPNPSSP